MLIRQITLYIVSFLVPWVLKNISKAEITATLKFRLLSIYSVVSDLLLNSCQKKQENFVTTQRDQFTAGLSRFGPAGTPSRASYHQGVAQYKHERALSCLATP